MGSLRRFYILLLCIEFLSVGLLIYNREAILTDQSSSILEWSMTWGGRGRDYAEGVTYSKSGVYIAGMTSSLSSGHQYLLLLKYTQEGELIWNSTYRGDGDAMARGLTVFQDAVYVCGIQHLGNASYATTLRYDHSGNLIWAKLWRGTANSYARGVSVDDFGQVYIVGYSRDASLETRHFVLKYNSSGELLWSREESNDSSEIMWGISVSDNVYICGERTTTHGGLLNPGEPRSKVIIRRISLDGDPAWEQSWYMGIENAGHSITAEADIKIVGYTRFTNGTARQVVLTLDTSGQLLSNRLYGFSWFEDIGWAVASGGNYLYVAGHTYSPYIYDLRDATTTKVGADGTEIWQRHYGGYGNDEARAVDVFGDDIYVAGECSWHELGGQVFILKYSSPNTPLSPLVRELVRFLPIFLGFFMFLALVTRIFMEFNPKNI